MKDFTLDDVRKWVEEILYDPKGRDWTVETLAETIQGWKEIYPGYIERLKDCIVSVMKENNRRKK